MSSTVPPGDRSRALDGLRGLAAIMVVFTHLAESIHVPSYSPGGFIGVLVFFVLSGYLITTICWRDDATWAAYRKFVRRRIVRLMPVAALLVLVVSPLVVAWGGVEVHTAVVNTAVAAAQLTGLAVAAGMEWHPVWIVTWSLTTEWCFYLLMPLGLMLARSTRMRGRTVCRCLWAGAVLLFAVALTMGPTLFYFLPVANLGVMLLGGALALRSSPQGATWFRGDIQAWSTAAVVLLVAVAIAPGSTQSWGDRIVMPFVAAATALVIEGCRHETRARRMLGCCLLSGLGIRAYSIDLLHLPVLWPVWFNTQGKPVWLVLLLFLAVLISVAELSYRLLERPVMRGVQAGSAGAFGRVARTGSPV